LSKSIEKVNDSPEGRYEIMQLGPNYYGLVDSQTGDFWTSLNGRDWVKKEAPEEDQ